MNDKNQWRDLIEGVLRNSGIQESEELADSIVEVADEEGMFEVEESAETLRDLLD